MGKYDSPSHWQKSLIIHPISHEIYSQSSFIGFWLRLRPWTWSPEKEKEMAVLEKLKKKKLKKTTRKKKKKSSSTIIIDIICIYFLGWYKIRPGRCWLPAVPFPWEESGASALKGVWDGGEFALSPGWIWLYQYLSTMCIYINVNSFIRIIGTRWCRPPFSYRTPVPVLITWEESGASALLELGAGPAAIWDMAQGINLPLIIHLRT